MMTDCEICLKRSEKDLMLFEDEKNLVFLSDAPAALGHSIVSPKEHRPILESIPDFDIGDLFKIANKVSSSLFESLNIQGTNIIIQNGTAANQDAPHFTMNVIPRSENDNLGLTWQPRQLDEEEMSTIELKIKEFTKSIGAFEEVKKEPLKIESKVEKIKESTDNYLLRQIRRIA